MSTTYIMSFGAAGLAEAEKRMKTIRLSNCKSAPEVVYRPSRGQYKRYTNLGTWWYAQDITGNWAATASRAVENLYARADARKARKPIIY